MNSPSPRPAIRHRQIAAPVHSRQERPECPAGSVPGPSPGTETPCFTLHHDGADWSLRQLPGRRTVARYQCRRAALRDSMARAHNSGAKLVLVPGSPI